MLDRNDKSQRILTKLCALDSEYIYEKNDISLKIFINSVVINFQISTTKYISFLYYINKCSH